MSVLSTGREEPPVRGAGVPGWMAALGCTHPSCSGSVIPAPAAGLAGVRCFFAGEAVHSGMRPRLLQSSLQACSSLYEVKELTCCNKSRC